MISIWNLLWIIPLSAVAGVFLAVSEAIELAEEEVPAKWRAAVIEMLEALE